MMSAFAKHLGRPMRCVAARSDRVPDPVYPSAGLRTGRGSDNCIAELRVSGPDLELTWRRVRCGPALVPGDGDPILTNVATVRITGYPAERRSA